MTLLLLLMACLLSYRFTGYPDIRPFHPEQIPPPWGAMTPAESVLVIAPHCDDETLGCGGLLSYAAACGSRVRVVVMTNGDGFPAAAGFGGLGRASRADRYTQLGSARQRETLSALRILGVEEHDVTFLGYPDGGLAKLWNENWEYTNPLTSRYTRVESSPYPTSFTPGALYCGRAVVDDLCEIISEFAPSLLFVPHPNDAHPDHWATHALTTTALQRLSGQGKLSPDTRVFAYLIHRGDWPVPRFAMLRGTLDPPSTLRHMPFEWIYQPLDDDIVAQKRRAILEYRSQVAIMRSYLLSFARRNELFTALHTTLARQLDEQLGEQLGEGGPSETDRDLFWSQAEPVTHDPRDDTIGRRLSGAADLSSVSAALWGDTLYLMIRPRVAVSATVRYTVRVCAFADDGNDPTGDGGLSAGGDAGDRRGTIDRTMAVFNIGPGYTLSTRFNHGLAGASLKLRRTGRGLELGIPLQLLEGSRTQTPDEVFFTVESSIGGIGVDRIGWTVLRLRPDVPDVYNGQTSRGSPDAVADR